MEKKIEAKKVVEILVVEDGHFAEAKSAAEEVNINSNGHINVVETAKEAYRLISDKKADFVFTDMMFKEELSEELHEPYLAICDRMKNYATQNRIPFVYPYQGTIQEIRENIKDQDRKMREGREKEDELVQYALGNVLYEKATEMNVPACIYTSTHRHNSFINGTYLAIPLVEKGLVEFDEYNPTGDLVDYGDCDFAENLNNKKLPLPHLVLDAKKNFKQYKGIFKALVSRLRKK